MSQDGYILTNNHVVEDADQIKVKLANGKEYEGKVVGRDPKTDLALVKIDEAPDLQPLKLGNSEDLKVGSWVVAVGKPLRTGADRDRRDRQRQGKGDRVRTL